MSTLVRLKLENPFIVLEYLRTLISNQPTLLCLPVVTPNSNPLFNIKILFFDHYDIKKTFG